MTMTSPRDALRALIEKWRTSANHYTDRESVRLRLCADELAAIVSQMDSEPTVAQTQDAGPKVEYRMFDSQWVNVVNHSHGYLGFSIENAVRKAAELTEKFMRENIEEGKFPRARASAAKEPK